MSSRPVLAPIPAVTGLLDLFATRPLVALGEMHGLQDEADFIAALLHHPAFPATVQVIVVEFGNARHQAVVDRLIAGEPVAARDLRPVWREFAGGFGFDAPIYEQFFRTVRAINRTLPPAQRLRVVLGDPPVDTSQISSHAEILPYLEQRDAHFAQVVETQVLAPGHRGLLIAGGMHFVRDWPIGIPLQDNVVGRLERNHPNSVHVILPHIGLGHETSAVEQDWAGWPIPSLASLHATWLGQLDAALLLEGLHFIPHPDMPVPPTRPGVTLSALADNYLYLGPRSSLTRSTINPAIYHGDEPLLNQLRRRLDMFPGGAPFKVEDLIAEGDARFFTD